MPLYEYSCSQCEKTFEAIQKFSDEPLTQCPTCQGPVARLISKTSFQLKGTGWYATDYKKSPAPAAPAAAKATKPTGGGESGSGKP